MKSNDSIQIEFDDNNTLISLFGFNDSNLRILEKFNKVKIDYRGNQVKIIGSKSSVAETRQTLIDLFNAAKKGIEIDEDKIKDTKSLMTLNNKNILQTDLFIQTKKKKIIPRSQNQKKYFELLNSKDIVFAIGPSLRRINSSSGFIAHFQTGSATTPSPRSVSNPPRASMTHP